MLFLCNRKMGRDRRPVDDLADSESQLSYQKTPGRRVVDILS